jgi:hypothetical protein
MSLPNDLQFASHAGELNDDHQLTFLAPDRRPSSADYGKHLVNTEVERASASLGAVGRGARDTVSRHPAAARA